MFKNSTGHRTLGKLPTMQRVEIVKKVISDLDIRPFYRELKSRAQKAMAEASVDPAHDFEHMKRVLHHALSISLIEGGRPEVLYAAAFLHDIKNLPKNHPQSSQSSELSAKEARRWIESLGLEFPESKWNDVMVAALEDAVLCHSFSRGLAPQTIEGKVFQDADRLDALGLMGVFRLMAVAGRSAEGLYCPDDPFFDNQSRPLNDRRWAWDHYYRKLRTLPGLMKTSTGRDLAKVRLEWIEQSLIPAFRNELSFS